MVARCYPGAPVVSNDRVFWVALVGGPNAEPLSRLELGDPLDERSDDKLAASLGDHCGEALERGVEITARDARRRRRRRLLALRRLATCELLRATAEVVLLVDPSCR